jgi:protocatechuate 4,5-dioxygenase beta chain
MAELVGGFLMPHDPLIAARPDAPPAAQIEAVRAAFAEISRRLSELRVDTVVNIGDDHYGMFSPSCIPQCFIAVGEVEGPIEPWLGIERAPIPNHPELAMHILTSGLAEGVGWSFAKWIAVDHSTVLPYEYCYRAVPGVRTIPVYLNDGVPPLIPNAAAYSVGESIGRAIASWTGGERVAICGTGGCSHWVGSPQMGEVNESFDRRLLALLEAGDIAAVMALSDDEVTREAGNGAMELKNWLCAIGAMHATRARLIAYEAVPQWISGIPFAELSAA